MTEIKDNLEHIKGIVRELYNFSIQMEKMKTFSANFDKREIKLLEDSLSALKIQLKILNNSIPSIIDRIRLYPSISKTREPEKKLTKISYNQDNNKVSVFINEEDKRKFLENLSTGMSSIKELKKKYIIESQATVEKANRYAKISNYFFRSLSYSLTSKGYFKNLNRNLRKINSPFILGTYVSMLFFSSLLSLIFSIILLIFLLFFDVSISYPFITLSKGILINLFKFIWIVFIFPITTGLFIYFYPLAESKNIAYKINQELPFVTIHMSAIASSGVEPVSIFNIIIKGKDYEYTNIEFRKLMNLINFHGEDIVSALRKTASSSSSSKLRDLLNGLAVTITSGSEIHQFLNKRAEDMLFEYRLEREKYTKMAETFMDIYISVAIAAPMIFLMIFVIMGSTGLLGNIFGMSTNSLSFLLILILILINILFLLYLKWKQPPI